MRDSHAQLTQALTRVNSMQHSASPQLAAPLRKGKALLASLARLIGTSIHRMHLEPVQEPVGEDSERRSAGADRRFRLSSSKGRSPTGWCLVSCAAAAGRKPMPMELCWDSGQGFSEHSKIRLQMAPSGRTSTLIRLPEQVARLRLDLLEPAGNLAPGAFVIREISGVAALAILLRPHLRDVVKHPRVMSRWSKQALTWLRTGGMKSLSQGLWRSARQRAYDQQQNATFEALKENDRHAILERMRGLRYQPLISIVMPVYNTPEKLLRAAMGSVVNQCYPHWELCVADDASAAAINGFRDDFFMYFEDFDLSLRIGGRGRLVCVPQVKIVHHGGNAADKGGTHIRMFLRSAVTFYSRYGWKLW